MTRHVDVVLLDLDLAFGDVAIALHTLLTSSPNGSLPTHQVRAPNGSMVSLPDASAGRPARRPRITPKRGTNTELSSSKKGSMLCIGSTQASAVQTTPISTPHWRTDQAGRRLLADTAPE